MGAIVVIACTVGYAVLAIMWSLSRQKCVILQRIINEQAETLEILKRKPPCLISEADCPDGQYADPVIWPGQDSEGNGRLTVGDKRTGRPLAFVGHTSTQWHMLINPANGTAQVMCKLEGIPVESRNGSHARS